MGSLANQEATALGRRRKGQSDGKTYGYQHTPETESSQNGATSLVAAKADLLKSFQQFVDVLVDAYEAHGASAAQSAKSNGAKGVAGTNVAYGGPKAGSMGGRGKTGPPSLGGSGTTSTAESATATGQSSDRSGQERMVAVGHDAAIAAASTASGTGTTRKER